MLFHQDETESKKTRAVIYARYSPRPRTRRHRAEPESASCDAQIAVCRRWCEIQGLEVTTVYRDDALSGKRIDNRPGLQATLRNVCANGGVLVVYSLSRLARSTKDAIRIFEKLNAAKADLISLRETIDTTNAMGRFVFTLMAAIATLEREQTSERTRDAMLRYQADGRRMSDCCPYGWRRREDRPALMEKDEQEQQVLARIIAERKRGRKLRQIGRILESEGLTCRGGPWYHQTIGAILRRAGVEQGDPWADHDEDDASVAGGSDHGDDARPDNVRETVPTLHDHREVG